MRPTLRLFRLRPEAELPRYQSEAASGVDLVAALPAPLLLGSDEVKAVPTGWSLAIPEGYEGQVRPRSGLAAKHSVTVPNAPGTIDADYRGELKVLLYNFGATDFTVEPRMRIAQLVVAPVAHVHFEEVDDAARLGVTARGSGGFGSTGL